MASLDLYSTGSMRNASVTSVTSETAGFPIENALDNNPDTAWRATSLADQTIDIDLGEAKTIDAIGIWIRNYDDMSFTITHKLALYSDDNDNGAYSAVTIRTTVYPDFVSGLPVQFSDDASPVSKRYWRVVHTYGTETDVVDLGGLWLMQKNSISKSSQLPRNDVVRYNNRVSQAGGGREFIRGVNSNSQRILPRTYMIGETDFTALQAAFDDSMGRRFPLIAVESGETTRLVRFTSDDLAQNELSHQIYNPTFGLIELPYIQDGEVY